MCRKTHSEEQTMIFLKNINYNQSHIPSSFCDILSSHLLLLLSSCIPNYNKAKQMISFNESSNQTNQSLHLARQKYYRNILNYNKAVQQQKLSRLKQSKLEVDHRYSRINQQSLVELERETQLHKRQRFSSQVILQADYERQIREKRERMQKQKQMDKNYAQQLTMVAENAERRRLQDLLRLYERRQYKVQPRKIKTECSQILNPERTTEKNTEKKDMDKQPYFFPFGPGLPKTHFPPLQPITSKKSPHHESVQSLLS